MAQGGGFEPLHYSFPKISFFICLNSSSSIAPESSSSLISLIPNFDSHRISTIIQIWTFLCVTIRGDGSDDAADDASAAANVVHAGTGPANGGDDDAYRTRTIAIAVMIWGRISDR